MFISLISKLGKWLLIEFVENATHRPAQVARLTARVKKMMDETMAAELGWAGRRARNFGEQEVESSSPRHSAADRDSCG